MKNSKTVLLGLNELNFEYINKYIEMGELPNFKRLFNIQKPIKTNSEKKYNLLEPWIQWLTVYTGKSFSEHKVYRLGDIVERSDLTQIFEELEAKGHSVAAVSPFNVDNRLNNSPFFIPDPWTKTKVSGNKIIRNLYNAIHKAVNDNAEQKIGVKSIFNLFVGFLSFVPVSRWIHFFKIIINFKKPGSKAIFLDSFLSDVFITLFKKHKPDFSHLFLNSGAHIQHHYLFNSNAYDGNLKNPDWYCPIGYDPIIKILSEYDKTIERLMDMDGLNLIVATGLHQQPHANLTYYWRLKNHVSFVKKIGINNFQEILPRMSRDFLIKFSNSEDSKFAENILISFLSKNDNKKIFNVDNRGDSLFVELVYPHEITINHSIYSNKSDYVLKNFEEFVAFVAIKNGEHNGLGYLTTNFTSSLSETINLKDVKKFLESHI